MFLQRDFRSTGEGIATQLLQKAIQWAVGENCSYVYSGTMSQFRAAQRFYGKQGFERIEEKELPVDYPGNNMDTVFYRKNLLVLNDAKTTGQDGFGKI
jgi:GNAT superfamily N-acetyltransferase